MVDKDMFDFDSWAQLAKDDPAAFEVRRKQLLQQQLDAAPERMRKRLEGLQWRIDRVRDQSQHPLGACIRISKMMWDGVLGDNGLVENLKRLSDAGTEVAERPRADARILPFSIPGQVRD
jgi:hypothetical protein